MLLLLSELLRSLTLEPLNDLRKVKSRCGMGLPLQGGLGEPFLKDRLLCPPSHALGFPNASSPH